MTRKSLIFTSVILALAVLTWGATPGWAQPPNGNNKVAGKGQLAAAERKAAAARLQTLGLQLGVAGLTAAVPNPGGIPHYFGPYGYWAYSPLPRGPVTAVTLVDGGTGYRNPFVTIDDVYGTGTGASIAFGVGTGGAIVFTGFVGGDSYSAPIVTIWDNTDLCGAVSQPACGTGAAATASIATATTVPVLYLPSGQRVPSPCCAT